MIVYFSKQIKNYLEKNEIKNLNKYLITNKDKNNQKTLNIIILPA
jgi:hypothetical protein